MKNRFYEYRVRRRWFSRDALLILCVPKNPKTLEFQFAERLRQVLNLLSEIIELGGWGALERLQKHLTRFAAEEGEIRAIGNVLNSHGAGSAEEEAQLLARYSALRAR